MPSSGFVRSVAVPSLRVLDIAMPVFRSPEEDIKGSAAGCCPAALPLLYVMRLTLSVRGSVLRLPTR